MTDDQFTKLYKYMQNEFGKIHTELACKADRDQVNNVYALLDQHVQQQEIDEQERLAMGAQLDRHEGWITQLAKNTKTKLVPEL